MPENTTAPTRRPVWLIAGASSGIGQAIALQVQPWARVIAMGRNTERLQQLAQVGFETIQLNFIDSLQIIRSALESIVDREGFIDVFVNAAGYILEGSVEETRYSGPYFPPFPCRSSLGTTSPTNTALQRPGNATGL